MSALEDAKRFVADWASGFAEFVGGSHTLYLQTGPTSDRIVARAREVFTGLSHTQKNAVYGKIWTLGKMADPRIDGINWGQEHVYDDNARLAKALVRLGFFRFDELHEVKALDPSVGEGSGIKPQYFSLGERMGEEFFQGRIGYVNGMGVPSLEQAGRDVKQTSEMFTEGKNIFAVYNSTHASHPHQDPVGFGWDVFRMKALDGGSYTTTTYLIVQQWIDYLLENPSKKFLQIGTSEGAAHINAALRLLKCAKPDLLSRIRVISLCPAYYIDPATYGRGLQVRSFVKFEDGVVNPWGANADRIWRADYIHVVRHYAHLDPHCHLSADYADAVKPFIECFKRCGDIY
jgi:hypothetical protein